MPHPSGTLVPDASVRGWGRSWGRLKWGGESGTGGVIGGQIVIRHDRSAEKRKRLRQRQRMN